MLQLVYMVIRRLSFSTWSLQLYRSISSNQFKSKQNKHWKYLFFKVCQQSKCSIHLLLLKDSSFHHFLLTFLLFCTYLLLPNFAVAPPIDRWCYVAIKTKISVFWVTPRTVGQKLRFLSLFCHFSGTIHNCNMILFFWMPSQQGRKDVDFKKQGALTIYTIHPGGNFRWKYSVLQLFQTQNGKIRKCISINWKFQKKKKKCID